MEELQQAFRHLKQSLPDYEERPQQLKMAGEIFECLKDKKRFLIEAGTGVGKSFAYLIPAILSQEKTVVSTVSIALQEQLVKKDLVFLHENLPYDFTFALLKGKNNYLCLKREKEYTDTGEAYKRFKKWCDSTGSGDKDELHFIPDFWGSVSADPDDCSGKLCPFYEECFYYRHYR
ncbi:MAG TPA: ATP-dependent helicase DinG, partial [Nitrospirota bacterium]|nr:ATP-dependent helicase DinG [Nitrospirota bacterium]